MLSKKQRNKFYKQVYNKIDNEVLDYEDFFLCIELSLKSGVDSWNILNEFSELALFKPNSGRYAWLSVKNNNSYVYNNNLRLTVLGLLIAMTE